MFLFFYRPISVSFCLLVGHWPNVLNDYIHLINLNILHKYTLIHKTKTCIHTSRNKEINVLKR